MKICLGIDAVKPLLAPRSHLRFGPPEHMYLPCAVLIGCPRCQPVCQRSYDRTQGGVVRTGMVRVHQALAAPVSGGMYGLPRRRQHSPEGGSTRAATLMGAYCRAALDACDAQQWYESDPRAFIAPAPIDFDGVCQCTDRIAR